MSDAPETIVLQPCFVEGWALPDRVKYETSIAIKYTRTDISQARIAQLEAALGGMLEHVRGEEFCLCEYKDNTYPADEGSEIDAARKALKAKP